MTFDEWFSNQSSATTFYTTTAVSRLSKIHKQFPTIVSNVLAQASVLLRHEFNLLGSNKFVPIDPERKSESDYQPIDWYFDPVAKVRFPRGIPYKQWDLAKMAPKGADVKLPWELARCQHWLTLAQAHLLSDDERFAQEIIDQALDFKEANPVGIGIHWACTMDVALRALNWTLALDLIRSWQGAPSDTWKTVYSHLYQHGQFIFNNLENHYEVTSNHYLSNVVGLFYLSVLFKQSQPAQEWFNHCTRSLEEEIRSQVLPDGSDFESSIPYHRLVTELFLGAARLASHVGHELTREYYQILERMVDFCAATLRPDGLIPQIGDADDGRLHVLSGYGNAAPLDGRHLFVPAALLLSRSDWIDYGNNASRWEAAWWGLDPDGVDTRDSGIPPSSSLFPDAGIWVYRDKANYLIVSNGIVGTRGFGNHKHNDQLSFEFHWNNVPIIVDPGTFTYTREPASRNTFRRTAYHNTLQVDGEEQNEINPDWLFRTIGDSTPKHLECSSSQKHAHYRGQHSGYQRLAKPVVHERSFTLQPQSGKLTIEDTLISESEHDLKWHFHFAPGITVERVINNNVHLNAGNVRLTVSIPNRVEATARDVWYSPSYGVRERCQCLELCTIARIAGRESWLFTISPIDEEVQGINTTNLIEESKRSTKTVVAARSRTELASQ